jgi:hypothetical protein
MSIDMDGLSSFEDSLAPLRQKFFVGDVIGVRNSYTSKLYIKQDEQTRQFVYKENRLYLDRPLFIQGSDKIYERLLEADGKNEIYQRDGAIKLFLDNDSLLKF